MYNSIQLIGRWTKDFDVRMTTDGTEVLNGSLAVNDPFKQDHTDFVDVTAFGKLAINTKQYSGKGKQVLVDGKQTMAKREVDM